jgi:hypothetical protein
MKDVIAIAVICILVGLIIVSGLYAFGGCLSSDWQCRTIRYQQRVEGCMATERLTMEQCEMLAASG